jgi:type I restriction enzyme S subunit
VTPSARLDEVCELVMGQAPRGKAYNTDAIGWPLIAGAGDFGPVHPQPKKFTTEAPKLSQVGDIVLGIRATIGEKVWCDGVYCLGRGVASLRAQPRLEGRYLWHWLTHVRPELTFKAKGATFKQVTRNDIGELRIALPSLAEQRRIADVLDQAEMLLAKRRAALVELDTLIQAIFLEMFGDPIHNPKHFPVARMIDLIDQHRPITYGILMPGPDQVSGVRYVRVVDMKDGRIDLSAIRKTTLAISRSYRRSLLKAGDVLMSIRGHVGRFAVVPQELDGANITQDTARLAIRGASPLFVRECLRTEGFQRWMTGRTKGVAVRGINLADVKLMPVILPSRRSQEAFAARATSVERLAAVHRASIAELDALFAVLQRRAFRGEL